jgi:agmatine deiminase
MRDRQEEETMRLPAEWEPQSGVLVAWPHERTDWCDVLAEVTPVFARIVAEVSRREIAVVVTPDGDHVREQVEAAGGDLARVQVWDVPTNDTWARDFGPITLLGSGGAPGRPLLLDFGFNGWGLKFASCKDNRVTRELSALGAFHHAELRTMGLVLEGGSIESDGRGTVLTTSQCLLSPNRNPHLDQGAVEAALREHLHAERVLWLHNGHLQGDDTDAHIDTLARLAPDDTIVYVACDDASDPHMEGLSLMARELRELRTASGAPYRLVPLPWPAPKLDADGRRMAASYANYLIINGAVLAPTYRDARDEEALAAIAGAHPGREVVGIDCLPLIQQGGSLHCLTMQLPEGVLR